jgi:hypothetical protein
MIFFYGRLSCAGPGTRLRLSWNIWVEMFISIGDLNVRHNFFFLQETEMCEDKAEAGL